MFKNCFLASIIFLTHSLFSLKVTLKSSTKVITVKNSEGAVYIFDVRALFGNYIRTYKVAQSEAEFFDYLKEEILENLAKELTKSLLVKKNDQQCVYFFLTVEMIDKKYVGDFNKIFYDNFDKFGIRCVNYLYLEKIDCFYDANLSNENKNDIENIKSLFDTFRYAHNIEDLCKAIKTQCKPDSSLFKFINQYIFASLRVDHFFLNDLSTSGKKIMRALRLLIMIFLVSFLCQYRNRISLKRWQTMDKF